MHKVEALKAKGLYREAGKLAYELGDVNSYGCHYGMRSELQHAREEFSVGYMNAKREANEKVS